MCINSTFKEFLFMCLLHQFQPYRNSSKIVLRKSKSEFLTLKQEILSMIVCSTENDSCILRESKICKDKTRDRYYSSANLFRIKILFP